jgi:RND family efflux transporter MFP subunit
MESLGSEIIQSIGNSGEPVLIADASDPRLVQRNGERTGGRILTLMAAPVIEGGDTLTAVLECVNRTDGTAFDEDDLFFLTMMAQTASAALHNASLMEAEKKIEVLETLVAVSGEITSTLNLERVLQVVVNGPQRIMSYDRAAIALQQRGHLQLKAVSGKTEIVHREPAMWLLLETLEFCSISDQEVYVVVRDGKVQASRQETRAEFARYFQQSGSRAWYAIPLQDDEGRLGILSFESRNPDFLTETHLELIKVVAAQATVALRNASLYTEVPFIGVLEPLLQKKQRFMRMGRNRRAALAGVAIAAALFLAVFPLPMRLDGTATVAPLRTAQIQTEMDGVVRAVHVREGDWVKRGTTLAELDDWDYRAALAGAQAKYQQALAQMNRALATNDGTEAGVQRVQAEYWQGEVQRARERLEHARLRSPIDGVVTTPHIEDLVGHKLDAGANFAQVMDSSRASIDVAVDQDDLGLVRSGESAVMKLDGFPTRKFRGRVAIVSPLGAVEGDRRVFMARVEVMNEDGLIRAGMQGKGKVFAGWRPAGYVLFRGMGIWLWTKLWSWFGW